MYGNFISLNGWVTQMFLSLVITFFSIPSTRAISGIDSNIEIIQIQPGSSPDTAGKCSIYFCYQFKFSVNYYQSKVSDVQINFFLKVSFKNAKNNSAVSKRNPRDHSSHAIGCTLPLLLSLCQWWAVRGDYPKRNKLDYLQMTSKLSF